MSLQCFISDSCQSLALLCILLDNRSWAVRSISRVTCVPDTAGPLGKREREVWSRSEGETWLFRPQEFPGGKRRSAGADTERLPKLAHR